MTLRETQSLFMKLLPRLIDTINETHCCTGGDLYAQMGHKQSSNHYIRLAIDINLFTKEGAYLTDSEAHRPFGEFWKSLNPLCRWGGDFKNKDGNHYSLFYEGRA